MLPVVLSDFCATLYILAALTFKEFVLPHLCVRHNDATDSRVIKSIWVGYPFVAWRSYQVTRLSVVRRGDTWHTGTHGHSIVCPK